MRVCPSACAEGGMRAHSPTTPCANIDTKQINGFTPLLVFGRAQSSIDCTTRSATHMPTAAEQQVHCPGPWLLLLLLAAGCLFCTCT